MRPTALSANALAKALHVPAPRINDVVRERRGITADTAMRLARYFGGDAQSWLNLQTLYDLRIAEKGQKKKKSRGAPSAAHCEHPIQPERMFSFPRLILARREAMNAISGALRAWIIRQLRSLGILRLQQRPQFANILHLF